MRMLLLLLLTCLFQSDAAIARDATHAPPLLLANVLDRDVDLAQYWVSEKYDGVRAYWSGRALLTRNGNVIQAPSWFTARLPEDPLDGELWIARGQFEAVMRTVRDARPDEAAWRKVRFMVFDLPGHPGTFDERLATLRALPLLPPAIVVDQFRVSDRADLDRRLKGVVDAGGEGLMLHRGDSRYLAGRSDDLLKLKPYLDAEARVVGYAEGKGKYRGMLGALRVERPDGVQFLLGSGLSDQQRREPPPLGTIVTYRFTGVTAKGLPRFARFVRVREETPAGTATETPHPGRHIDAPYWP